MSELEAWKEKLEKIIKHIEEDEISSEEDLVEEIEDLAKEIRDSIEVGESKDEESEEEIE
ncbi:MAG: hypothetical protein ABH950_04595 [Candidatus Altiarchaeota archaeon]